MMKRLMLAALLALGLASPAQAQAVGAQQPYNVFGQGPAGYDMSYAVRTPQYCQVTVTTTATLLSALFASAGCVAVPSWATVAYVTPENAATIAVRWRSDGTAPTSTVGDPIFGNTKDPSILGYAAISTASLISATGASVTVSVRIGG